MGTSKTSHTCTALAFSVTADELNPSMYVVSFLLLLAYPVRNVNYSTCPSFSLLIRSKEQPYASLGVLMKCTVKCDQ